MNFTRQNNFYSKFLYSNLFIKYLITFILLNIIFFSWFFLYYEKINSQIKIAVNDIYQLEKEKKLLEKTQNDINQIKLDINFFNNKLEEIFLSKNKNSELNLDSIIKCIEKSDMLLRYCSSEERTDKKLYSKSLISFTLNGSFYQLIKLINFINSLEKIVTCKKIIINRIDDLTISVECIYKFYESKLNFVKCSDTNFIF